MYPSGEDQREHAPPWTHSRREESAIHLDRLASSMGFARATDHIDRALRFQDLEHGLHTFFESILLLKPDADENDVVFAVYKSSIVRVLRDAMPDHTRISDWRFVRDMELASDYIVVHAGILEDALIELEEEGRVSYRHIPDSRYMEMTLMPENTERDPIGTSGEESTTSVASMNMFDFVPGKEFCWTCGDWRSYTTIKVCDNCCTEMEPLSEWRVRRSSSNPEDHPGEEVVAQDSGEKQAAASPGGSRSHMRQVPEGVSARGQGDDGVRGGVCGGVGH